MPEHVLKDGGWVMIACFSIETNCQPAEVSEEGSSGSGPGLLPECLDPGGLMVNSLSLIGLGLELELKRK